MKITYATIALICATAAAGCSAAPTTDGSGGAVGENSEAINGGGLDCRPPTYACGKTCCKAPPTPKAETGSIVVKYEVMSVLYAPPGSAAMGDRSSADYSATSSTGTSTKVASSFSNKDTLKASGNYAGDGLSVTTTASFGSTSSDEVDVTVTDMNEFKITGPSTDGIDHNQDQILLWLHPTVTTTILSGDVSWGASGGQLSSVYVLCLKEPAAAGCSDSLSNLAAAGIVQSDYATILARDPFANGQTSIDTGRFEYVGNFSYTPMPAGGSTLVDTKTFTNEHSEKQSLEKTDQFSVAIEANTGVNVGVVKAQLTSTSEFTWTNTSTFGNSTSNKQSATVGIIQPSAAWKGLTNVNVYFDTIYSTFAFALEPLAASPAREFKGAGSGLCLNVVGGATAAGSPLQIWPCQGTPNEVWTLTAQGELKGEGSGLCLDVVEGATTAGSHVQMWTCTGTPNQQWTVDAQGELKGVGSGLCLNVVGGATSEGSPLQIWPCQGTPNEVWTQVP